MKNTFSRTGLLILTISFVSAYGALCMGVPPHLPGIVELQSKVAAELVAMDADLASVAAQLSPVGLGAGSAKILKKLYDNHRSIVDVATIDPNGRLITITPNRYKRFEGQLINGQTHVVVLKETGRPVMSDMFKTIEGFYGVSLAYPITGPQGQNVGSVSIVFKPDALIGNIVKPYLAGSGSVEVLALQKDGRIIYDRDPLQIGMMTFSAPLYQNYPSLLKLARQVTAETTGSGTYTFPAGISGSPVKKATEWATVSLHGTEWRLIVSKQ